MTIGDRIRIRREELNLSQDELAHKLGYKSRSSINKIEKDGRELPQSKIKAIADALETTPSYIMGWEEETLSVHTTKFNELNEQIEQVYGKDILDLLNKIQKLDSVDRAMIQSGIDALLNQDKYSTQEGLKNA